LEATTTTVGDGRVIRVHGFDTIQAGVIAFTLSKIRSHASKLSTTFKIETTDSNGNVFDDITTGLAFTPIQGNLTQANIPIYGHITTGDHS
jgi:hypothetical protein